MALDCDHDEDDEEEQKNGGSGTWGERETCRIPSGNRLV